MADGALVKKLLFKPGWKALVFNPPAGYVDGLKPLPEGVEFVARPSPLLDFAHLFVESKAALDRYVPQVLPSLKVDGIFWISYPKGSAKVKTDLNRDILQKLMEKRGFAGIAVVSIDETWSAMRFRSRDKVGKSRKD